MLLSQQHIMLKIHNNMPSKNYNEGLGQQLIYQARIFQVWNKNNFLYNKNLKQ